MPSAGPRNPRPGHGTLMQPKSSSTIDPPTGAIEATADGERVNPEGLGGNAARTSPRDNTRTIRGATGREPDMHQP